MEQTGCVSHGYKTNYNNKEQLAPAHRKEKAEKKMCENDLSVLISLGGWRVPYVLFKTTRALWHQSSQVAKAALPPSLLRPPLDLARLPSVTKLPQISPRLFAEKQVSEALQLEKFRLFLIIWGLWGRKGRSGMNLNTQGTL